MRGFLTHAALVAAFVVVTGCSKPDSPPTGRSEPPPRPTGPKAIPDDVVEAWKKGGANLRVMTVSSNNELIDVGVTGQLRGQELPAFGLHRRSDLAGLPPVPVPFGLILSSEWTDDDLKQLIGLKNLKRLDLAFTKITDKGLVHLQQLTGLERLKLRETRTDPANVQKLRAALPDCVIER